MANKKISEFPLIQAEESIDSLKFDVLNQGINKQLQISKLDLRYAPALVDNENYVTDDEKADIATIDNKVDKNGTDRLVSLIEVSTWNSKQNALGFTPENVANKGQNNGYCGLDSGGKVALANLPSTLLKCIGQWNAETNTPTLISPDVDKAGYVYDVSVSGTQFGLDFVAGDWLIYNSNGIPKLSKDSDSVVTVNGQTGAVVLDAEDVGAVPNTERWVVETVDPTIVEGSIQDFYGTFQANLANDYYPQGTRIVRVNQTDTVFAVVYNSEAGGPTQILPDADFINQFIYGAASFGNYNLYMLGTNDLHVKFVPYNATTNDYTNLILDLKSQTNIYGVSGLAKYIAFSTGYATFICEKNGSYNDYQFFDNDTFLNDTSFGTQVGYCFVSRLDSTKLDAYRYYNGVGDLVIGARYAEWAENAQYANSAGSASTDGNGNNLASLFDGTGGNVAYAQSANNAATAGNATNATNDGNGTNIASNYVKNEGTSSYVDNGIMRSNGTTGLKAQSSGIVINDDNYLVAPNNILTTISSNSGSIVAINTNGTDSLLSLKSNGTGNWARIGSAGSPLAFLTNGINDKTNTAPALYVNNSGQIGINTISLTTGRILDVNGSAVFGQIGTGTSTPTPLNVSFGSTYGANTPGDAGNLKWDMYTANTGSRYGIGMSSGLMEFQSGNLTGGAFGFFSQGAENFRILPLQAGLNTPRNPFYNATTSTTDTLNDTRTRNNAGVYTLEKCTVANAAKGSGTWSGGELNLSTVSFKSQSAQNVTQRIYNDASDDLYIGNGAGSGKQVNILSDSATYIRVGNGSVGIGTNATAILHLRAPQSTAANKAPLKFSSAGNKLDTPESGAVEFDGNAFYFTESLRKSLTGLIYSSSQNVTVTGTTVTDLLSNSAYFTTATVKQLPANSMIANRIIRVKIRGWFSFAANQDAILSLKLGNTTIKSITESFPNGVTDYYFDKEIDFSARTVGATGTVMLHGKSHVQNGTAGQDVLIPFYTTTPVTVDTTIANTIAVNFNWVTNNAANSLKVDIATIEVL